MVTPAVGERLIEDGVDGRKIDAGIDPADLDPRRRRRVRLEPYDQIDLHVPDVTDADLTAAEDLRRPPSDLRLSTYHRIINGRPRPLAGSVPP